jgi:hypothetical protein
MFEKAIECFDECILLNPTIRIYFYEKGCCLLKLKKYNESLEFLNKSILSTAIIEFEAFDCKVFCEKGMLKLYRYSSKLKILNYYILFTIIKENS